MRRRASSSCVAHMDDALRASCADLLCREGTAPMHDIARLFASDISTSTTYKTFVNAHGEIIIGMNMFVHRVNRYEQPIEFLTLLRAMNPRDVKEISRHAPKVILFDAWKCQTLHIITTTQILASSMCYGQSFFSPKKSQTNFSPNLISIASEAYAPQVVCDKFNQSVNNIMYITSVSGSVDMTNQIVEYAKKHTKPLIVVKLNDDNLLNVALFETLVIGDLTYLFHHTALRDAMTPATPSAKKFKQSHESCDSLHSFSPLSNFSAFSALSPTQLNNIFDSVDSDDENISAELRGESGVITGKSLFSLGKPTKKIVNHAQLLHSRLAMAKEIVRSSEACSLNEYTGLYKEFPNFLEQSNKLGDDNTTIMIFIISNQQNTSSDTLELLSHCDKLDIEYDDVFTNLSLDKLLSIFTALCTCVQDDLDFQCADILFYLIGQIISKTFDCHETTLSLSSMTASLLAIMILNYKKIEEKIDLPLYSHIKDICNDFSLNVDSDMIHNFIMNDVIAQIPSFESCEIQ